MADRETALFEITYLVDRTYHAPTQTMELSGTFMLHVNDVHLLLSGGPESVGPSDALVRVLTGDVTARFIWIKAAK